MSINQKEGVYVAVMNFLADQGIGFDDGQPTPAKELLGKDGRKQVVAIVTANLVSGEITMSSEGRAKYQTEEAMSKYSNELVANWLKKDTRLNGGAKHETKNPGSRAGAGDDIIRELKKLKSAQADNAEAVAMIDEAIAARKTELGVEQVKTITVDASKIPASLQHLVK